MTIVNAIILKNGRIINNNVNIYSRNKDTMFLDWIPFNPLYSHIRVFHSTFSEPNAPLDQEEIIDLKDVLFIRPWNFHEPDLYSSFHRICTIACNDLKHGNFKHNTNQYHYQDLKS